MKLLSELKQMKEEKVTGSFVYVYFAQCKLTTLSVLYWVITTIYIPLKPYFKETKCVV